MIIFAGYNSFFFIIKTMLTFHVFETQSKSPHPKRSNFKSDFTRFIYKNVSISSGAGKDTEIVTSKITTIFLIFNRVHETL